MVEEIKFSKYYKSVKYLESTLDIERPEYMENRHSDGSFFLLRMKELIKYLDIDLSKFKYIHIAGTSGKGSTTALVHQLLIDNGKKVGSFYSPHPTTSIERIKVGDKYISPSDFTKLIEKIKPIVKKMSKGSKYGAPSYFEIFLAMALIHFTKKKCEYVVLETGCGGEFDATNAIPAPLVSAITNIGFDHMQILGKTLEKIAKTKAGIIKKGSICVTTEKRDKLLKIFESICKTKKAKFISIKGSNEELAIEIGRQLGLKKLELKPLKLSCRLESIQKNPRVILDGAHNYDKLKSTFNNLENIKYNKLYLIFTLNENKEVQRIIKMVSSSLPKGSEVILTKHLIEGRACAMPKMMYNLFPSGIKDNISIYTDPWEALERVIKKARKNDLILITGSFYLAGELRKKWILEEEILRNNETF